MTSSGHVVIAMSGGVDSSVAAALLVHQGFQVTGMMLRLWNEPGSEAENRCCTPDAMHMARRVAGRLGIPFYTIDAQEIFKQIVVDTFVNEYARSVTPNPCLVCNRHIRWGFLFQRALAIGANFMATGHYARVQQLDQANWQLLRAIDHQKDQTYVLHVLQQDQLAQSIFPLGNYTKSQVRQLAHQFNLPVAERSESQDLCFLGNDDYRNFLVRHSDNIKNPGPILDRSGKKIGEHQGLAFYTIGQRKGIRIASSIPLYVLEKDPIQNTLIVGPLEESGKGELIASQVNWISGKCPEHPFEANIKIRYKAQEVTGSITPLSDQKVHIKFRSKLRDITPGQAAVFYTDQVCLGGGIIQPD